MANTLRNKFIGLFKKSTLPVITETSTLKEISQLYPEFYPFIKKRYGITITSQQELQTLKQWVIAHNLPPAQVVFMEVQMESRSGEVGEMSAREATSLIYKKAPLAILDVREDWELKVGVIPNSLRLNSELLDQILQTWDKDKPLLLYCHFGVRSLDAASFLADHGFKNVYILKGGIDSWSTEVDPSIPRYEGAYC